MMSVFEENCAQAAVLPEPDTDLTFLVSEMEVELEQKEEMFQAAVEYGKRLEEEVQKLEERLEFWMQSSQSAAALEQQSGILEESLRESMLNEHAAKMALLEVTRNKDMVEKELNHRKEHNDIVENEYMNILKNVEHLDKRRITEIEKLQDEVVRDEINLTRTHEAFQEIRSQHRECQSRLKSVLAENLLLKQELEEKERMFGEVILGLSAEKARLEQDYSNLVTEYDNLASELKVPEMPSAIVHCRVLSSSCSFRPLSAEIEELSDDGEDITEEFNENEEEKIELDHTSSRKKREMMVIPDVLREYLHITASAVKLHFPEVIDVKSEQLISVVQHIPFHKYYERMTEYMDTLKKEKEDEVVLVSEVVNKPPKNVRRFRWFSGR